MDLGIVGRHALLFDDDFQAAFVNSREALVPWNENQSLLIDRYDVRHLLSSIPPPSSRAHPSRVYIELETDGLSRSDLDRERYLDLPEDEPDDGESGFKGAAMGEDVINGRYQAVPLSYGDNGGSISNSNADDGSDYSGYHPCFPLPEYLLKCLPPSEKFHQIIARTAMFVSKHGGQSEIVLRVKQGDNPTFGFLMPTHHLHAYFRYLVEHPNLLNICPVDARDEKNMLAVGENESRLAGEALSSLGSLYGSLDEDEYITQEPSDKKRTELGNPADTNTGDLIQQIVKEEFSVLISGRETKSVPYKDSTLSLKKNLPVVAPNAISVTSKAKAKTDPLGTSPSKAYPSASNIEKLIVEPPSTMKEAISKIVEFILRNGREFETVLIEQDRSHGRFPFLLPTNLYHAYYLKVLHEAQEFKRLDKKPNAQKHDSHQKLDGSRKSRERYGSAPQSSASQSEGLYDPQRKEKFKMVIGGGKKDSPESSRVPAKDSGVSVDVAAAIVMAATRGLSSPMEFQKSKKPMEFQKSDEPSAISADMSATRGSRSPPESDNPSTTIARESGSVLAPGHSRPSFSFGSLSTDMAAKIVMAATRGSRSPPESCGPSTTIVRDSGSVLTPGQSRPSSSFGSLSALQSGSISISGGRVSNIAPSSSIPRISPVSNDQLDGKCTSGPDSVKVANAMAKNVALAAACEADSSEASMTKEQKLKAERLKRAKLFTSLIRSGGQIADKLLPASVEQIGSHVAGSGSAISGSVSDLSRREREGSSVPVDAGSPHNSDENDSSRQGVKHRSRKHSSRTRGSDDDDFEEYSCKKRHSESDRKERRHKRHKHHSSNASKHESSEDEVPHRKRSSSGHCHYRHGDTFDEEYHDRSDSHRRRKAHTERKQPVHKQEEMATILEESDGILTKSKSAGSEGIAPTSSWGSQPDNTGISDDLRAKVRAMLMATL